jgi:hypothetical protein
MGRGPQAWAWIESVEGRKQSEEKGRIQKAEGEVACEDYNGGNQI